MSAAPSRTPSVGGAGDLDDVKLLDALRSGDERVYADLVARWSGAMVRLALVHVGSRSTAEDVVQDAWLTVVRDLDRFEGRSSLRTWVLGIVVNVARARARSERRSRPVSDVDAPIVDPRRFRAPDADRWPGHWAVPPMRWPEPDEALVAGEALNVIVATIRELPVGQREVVVLRDIEGLDARETCGILGLTDANQRVLLHRARSRVRNALERYFDTAEET